MPPASRPLPSLHAMPATGARLLAIAGLLAGTGLLATGCAGTEDDAGTGPTVGDPSSTASAEVLSATDGEIRGIFQPWTAGATAVTYDPALVPAGATAEVVVMPAADGVSVRLSVTGLRPDRTYGAHLHTKPCTAMAAEAGPHYQHMPDPKAAASPPPNDPAFANPRNEVWLDFTTDKLGTATADSTEDWPFDQAHPPRSLIVHAQHTSTEAGKAGTAGPRVACLTLPG